MDNFGSAPALRSPHPIWSYLHMEKRRLEITPGFLVITGEYCGITGGRTESIFECTYGEVEEPIQTHPDFTGSIAGKPSAPENGAIFVDVETGQVSTDDTRGVFTEFRATGTANDFSGVTSFLSPQATMRETWISTSPVIAVGLGHLNSPPFSVALPSGANWLLSGVSFQQRASIYVNTLEWKSSGRRGWNSLIYS